ncbi:MAG TPA: CBS domain-containing protein [Pyrinomonadaceae bacterium]|nr:CBS domain-containing protein [Pyrinomonadaceae bacterium]
MSRYRNDRDDDYFFGGRERGRYYEDERGGGGRRDYYGRGGRDFDEDRRGLRGGRDIGGGAGYGGGGGGRDFDDYGGGVGRGGYGGRGDFYRDDYDDRPVRRGRRFEEDDERDDRDERGGRSLFDEGRDYLRRTFGGERRRERGATRSHVRCRDIMTRDVTVATRNTTLQEVAAMMRDEDTGVIPVVDHPESLTDLAEQRPDINRVQPNVVGGSKLVGLITDRDIVVRAIAEGKDARVTRAEEIMTTEVHTAHPNDRVVDAIRKMGDKQVRRIPVVDRDNVLRGIISMADVALETEDDRELAGALEEISSGQSFWNKVFG